MHKHGSMWEKVGQTRIWEEYNVKILGINIDSKLSFNHQVSLLSTKSGRKLTTLTRLDSFLTLEKHRILMKAFNESQLS